ncbi:MAG: alcohol dehydrogenase catalytic domain-containing protein [Propionicimonas sp.]
MRAVSYSTTGGPLNIVEVDSPTCPEAGAVIEVRATGVCRSDWHAWRGHDPVTLPHIPGHEFAGVVAHVGPRVTGFAVGDRVTAPFVNGCGGCDYCLTGHAQVCPSQTQPGFTGAGSFAEHVVVEQADTNLVRLPDGLDFVTAAALGCRFATSFHALTAQAELRAGEWVVVFGCGGVGLSAVMVAHCLGASVVAVDPSPAARARAAELGADVVVDAFDPVPQVLAVTAGGAHVGMDAVGSAATAAAAVHSLRRRGRHVQVGLMLEGNSRAPLPWDLVVARELRILGSHGMAAADYPVMLELILAGRLHPELLVGRVIGFDDLAEALRSMDEPSELAGIAVADLARS